MLALWTGWQAARAAQFNVTSGDGSVAVAVDATSGLLTHVYIAEKGSVFMHDATVEGYTQLAGCTVTPGTVVVNAVAGGVAVHRLLACPGGYSVSVTDRFTQAQWSVQWAADVLVNQGVLCCVVRACGRA